MIVLQKLLLAQKGKQIIRMKGPKIDSLYQCFASKFLPLSSTATGSDNILLRFLSSHYYAFLFAVRNMCCSAFQKYMQHCDEKKTVPFAEVSTHIRNLKGDTSKHKFINIFLDVKGLRKATYKTSRNRSVQ